MAALVRGQRISAIDHARRKESCLHQITRLPSCKAGGTDSYGGAIFILPALGGAERKVIDLDALASPWQRSLSWSRDSKSLVVAARPAAATTKGLYVVNVDTGDRRQLTSPNPAEEDMQPAVSPDGQHVAFTRDTGRGISTIMMIPFGEGTIPRSLPAPLPGLQPVNFYNALPTWTPDGSHVVFASNAGGEPHLWLASARGSAAPVELAALGYSASEATVSATGELAFMHETFNTNIWKLDLSTSPPNPVETIASTRLEQSPAISPDGTRIAFESNVSGYSEIWASNADGSNPVQLTFLQNPVTGSPDWSPDGTRIVFDSRVSGHPQLYSIPANGGKPSILSQGNVSGVVPHWSPDGRSIYYSSDRTGRMEIWRLPTAGDTPEQVTFDGGFAAVPSRDGESLYYRSNNSGVSSLWELRLATGKRTLVSSSVINRAYAAAPDGAYFFSRATGATKQSLFFFDKRTLQKRLIFQSDKPAGAGMMLSPDGQALYYTQLDRSEHELFLVQQFWKK